MKKQSLGMAVILLSLCLPFSLVSCSVDGKYDLNKDIDMTVSVGKGLSLPIGSTEKIMLTELIDTSSTEVIRIDIDGNYSIYKEGKFTPEAFTIDELDIDMEPEPEKKHYDFELIDVDDDIDNLPEWIKQEILMQKYPYKVHNEIDYSTVFNVDQSVPEEMKSLRSLTFKENATITLDIKIFSENHMSDDLLEIVKRLRLKSDAEGGFVVNVPEYIVFADKSIKDGKVVIEGDAVYNAESKALEFSRDYVVEGLDFSGYKGGSIAVVDGMIAIHDTLMAVGFVESDTVFFAYDNLSHIQAVDVEAHFEINGMHVKSVEGIFAPDIEPIKESVDLELGDDLDFLRNDAYLDFNDPRIYVTFTNPVEAKLLADAMFVGVDKEGKEIDGSQVTAQMVLDGATENRIFVNRYATAVDGYTTLQVPSLNNLIKRIPERIEVRVDARMDDSSFSKVNLGEEQSISGSYRVSVPLEFDELAIVYTEEIDNVLGDDSDEITDYVKDINSITLTFDVLNTVPAAFEPSVIAYDASGKVLAGISVSVEGTVASGNGMLNGELTEPVLSSVAINISAQNGELEKLEDLDIRLEGKGCGSFNAKEYIQLKDIVVTIDDNIDVDLN